MLKACGVSSCNNNVYLTRPRQTGTLVTTEWAYPTIRSAQLQVWNQPPLSNYRPRSSDQSTTRTVLLLFSGFPVQPSIRSNTSRESATKQVLQ